MEFLEEFLCQQDGRALKLDCPGSGWAVNPEVLKRYADVALRERVWGGVGVVRLDSVIFTDSTT